MKGEDEEGELGCEEGGGEGWGVEEDLKVAREGSEDTYGR